ncbi:MAG TPA: DUF3795 domain-containing protein [Methanothrix sp.]|nr:DUF3795 domain-containing protein [Methanothrix sp.]
MIYIDVNLPASILPNARSLASPSCARRRGHSTRAAVDRGLDWMTTYTRCAGCRNGGGPPDCAIRICARERGYELCSSCGDLEGCTKFEWLEEHGVEVREKLKECRGLSREEHVRKMRSSFSES